jgi:hypothetical protein
MKQNPTDYLACSLCNTARHAYALYLKMRTLIWSYGNANLGIAWRVSLPLLSAGVAWGDWACPPAYIQEQVVSLEQETPELKALQEQLKTLLTDVKAEAAAGVKISATADKCYLMWGDIFKTGNCFALLELKEDKENSDLLERQFRAGQQKVYTSPATLALAEWIDKKWVLRGLWRMALDWVPLEDRWNRREINFGNSDNLHVPFELADLMDDDAPEVIVSGEKSKYFQTRYVMKFDKKSRGLDLLTCSCERPLKVGSCLRIDDRSPNKAIWSEWTFLEWKDGKLKDKAMWHSESPYNDEDPPFILARSTGEDGTIENFHVKPDGGEAWDYEIWKEEKLFAKLKINWKPKYRLDNGTVPEYSYKMEEAWIFEKLTGLAREDYPDYDEVEKLARLEEFATVAVEITPENEQARKRFPEQK